MVARRIRDRGRRRLGYQDANTVFSYALRIRFWPRPPTFSTTRIREKLQALDAKVGHAHCTFMIKEDIAERLAERAKAWEERWECANWERMRDDLWDACAIFAIEADLALVERSSALQRMKWCTTQEYRCLYHKSIQNHTYA